MFEIAGGIIIAIAILHLWPLIALAFLAVIPFVFLAWLAEGLKSNPSDTLGFLVALGIIAVLLYFFSDELDKPVRRVSKEPEPEPQRPIPEIKKRVNLLGRRQRLNPKVNQLLIMRRIAKKKKPLSGPAEA